MGWTRFLLLGDIGQQFELNDHAERLSRMVRRGRIRDYGKDNEQDEHLRELEAEVMQLNAALAAVVDILRQKGIATEQEIAKALESAVREGERAAAAKATAKQEEAAAKTKEAALRKLERLRRKRSD